ncbi:pisatin demethylase [Dothidotthia symphoricarpi CBS 119687]|uniref:Pisatin demethylase n=1 Tax=Dothidotthia symphoricarpi CBS 119687 TaxID=1392245 RepID=A0A6A6A8Y6_9PLEO|nr:pisatin demethylase [Dothidotthia symphoricarpi CBS 119687]KAF2128299.1 pisatin demethylase [Dothidotthia symphoricarpi CBS 119687]
MDHKNASLTSPDARVSSTPAAILLSSLIQPAVASIVFFAICLVYAIYSIAQYARLRAFKGPSSAAWSKFWLLRCVQSGRMHHILQDISTRYGKFARIGPNTLLVSDVEFVRRVNAPKSKYHRSDWYKGSRFTPGEDTLISMTNEVEHKTVRSKMTVGYNLKKENERCESAIDSQLEVMLNLIESKYISDLDKGDVRLLDWGYLASYFSIDSITDIAFSQPIGDLKEDKDKWNFLHNTEDNIRSMSFFTIYPEILNKIPLWVMVKYLAPHPDDNSPFGMVMGFARKCARERYGEKKVEKDDMLGVFVRQGMSQYEAERTSLLQLVAGSDTVATSLRAAILYIASDPSVVHRIRTEVAAAGVSSERPTSDIISYGDARKIRYILAVVREVLRVHPPAIATMEKQLGNESDLLPDGRVIPARTNIALSLTAILRDPETFGADAELFRPERWLEDVDEEQKKKMDRAHELIFGSGRFLCLGREIAMMHIVKIVIEIFNRYDISVLHPEKPWHSLAYGIFVQHDQWVKVTRKDLRHEGFSNLSQVFVNEKPNGSVVL